MYHKYIIKSTIVSRSVFDIGFQFSDISPVLSPNKPVGFEIKYLRLLTIYL